MLREKLIGHRLGENNKFRWRSHEISRIEGLSDAVFAFAVTLLVVSLEVPKTFDELAVAMRGFGAFAICFALLFIVWFNQYKFFRRYGLQDALTVCLNGALLFVVGYVAVFAVFVVLHLHALQKRSELELNRLEIFDTRNSIQESALNCGVGLMSIA